jgi:glycosyltransferase involved in cell wall biosynthesis
MKALHVNAGNLYGGIEVLLATMARYRHLCPQMESHFVVCFEGRLSRELTELGVPVETVGRVRTREFWTVWRARRRFRELLDRGSYDVVICHGAWAHAILGPVARTLAIPLVFWLHDPPKPRLFLLERWAGRLEPEFVICNSRYTANSSAHFYPRAPKKVIYCPVACRESKLVSSGGAGAVRAELNTPQDATVILQVSRLDLHKGHRIHIDALARLKDIPGWICWQVANPQRPHEVGYLAGLKAQAVRLGIEDRVRFLGWQPDIGRLFAAADIYCQPNVGPEPFGITFVEALYDGLPVVATALGGALEIVDSSCGILVSQDDSTELAEALRSLIQDKQLRTRLGRFGPARAEALCSPVRQLAEVHETLLKVSSRAVA